jgi:hypothetical protein
MAHLPAQQYGPRLEVPPRRPVPQAPAPARRHQALNDNQANYELYYFHAAAREKECKSYRLHRNIRGRAVAKGAQREHREPHTHKDWDYVFPPSVIQAQCNAGVVKELLDCNCRICGSFEVDLSVDASIISDVDPEVRFSIAVLAYSTGGGGARGRGVG